MRPMFRVVVGAVAFTVPITMTVMDVFGYVAKVEGASMQPCLNPEESKKPDYVMLNRWRARNFEFERGEVVSLSGLDVIRSFQKEERVLLRLVPERSVTCAAAQQSTDGTPTRFYAPRNEYKTHRLATVVEDRTVSG
ncbi:hypothetical protein LSH36_403g00000 [Paralvinella palmiformis]|uniref:Mitochondrial inner membrane protease subunit 2 n=1 Tax=Paralvinella palmiformis TaxID=53620 RepID=A0AAD9JD29_9ANNE|nr:hypothetical protein LSH36_403g00000 [Paralvinella palmiformis]